MKGFLRKTLCFVLAMFLMFAPTNSVFALDSAELNFFSQNGIFFYDPEGADCYRGSLRGDNIAEMVTDYLRGNNPTGFVMSDVGIAGILANFQHESAFNPFRFEGDRFEGPGYGIAQFTGMQKILDPLMSDPRTANYYNKYFDVKYTYTDRETGFPVESVPRNVIDAWLSVQLDFFLSAGSEFDTTRVGSYRYLGGDMGLDYIADNLTAREAMDQARTPEDAARIFVWIMERPANKEGAANGRAEPARYWYDYVQKTSFSSSQGSALSTSDGSDVTIIGDSITLDSLEKIREQLPNADVRAQAGKKFAVSAVDNLSGMSVLQELANGGGLRDIVVFALGTNDSASEENVNKVVGMIGSERKVIFVTNYTIDDEHIGNNNNFVKAKNDNSNVSIADWKAAVMTEPSKYLESNGVDPNEEGRALFATIIANAVNDVTNVNESCDSVLQGGLDRAQAQKLADAYNAISESELRMNFGIYDKGDCPSFPQWFVATFTKRDTRYFSDNDVPGRAVAHIFAEKNSLSEGREAKPFSIFSVTEGVSTCGFDGGGICGHTGIVVGVDGNDVITIESWHGGRGWGPNSGAFVLGPNNTYENVRYGNVFTYLEPVIDFQKLEEFLRTH